MDLKVQLFSFFVSYFYGMFFYLTLELNKKMLYSSKMFIKIVFSFLFVFFHTLFYFLFLMYINYGYIHLYFFINILLGYIICQMIYKKIVNGNKM